MGERKCEANKQRKGGRQKRKHIEVIRDRGEQRQNQSRGHEGKGENKLEKLRRD